MIVDVEGTEAAYTSETAVLPTFTNLGKRDATISLSAMVEMMSLIIKWK